MRRLNSLCFAWLVVLLLAISPILSAAPLTASAQTVNNEASPPADETPIDEPTVAASPEAPAESPTIEEPPATEVPTETATEPVASPEVPTTEPTVDTPPTEEPSATVEPTETEQATETEPTATATAKPTKTATATPDEGSFSSAAVEDLLITLNCTGSPESIRVLNVGTGNILLKSLTTYLDTTADEPFAVNRTLKPGQTAIYSSGNGAQYGTVLTNRYIFTNSAYDSEGVRISTSVGKATKMCAPKPPPPAGLLSDLSVKIDCLSAAETIRVSNNGTGWITIKGFASFIDVTADEPIATNRVLKPGQTGIFQSGESAKYGTILTTNYLFTNAAYEKDGIRISTSVGKIIKACPAKPVPLERWIEVNLSNQYLIAWYGNTRVNETYVSTGKPGFETPTGTYYVLYRYRYDTMAGCIQGECYYVPDVPWTQYFTNYGHALHGAYWHNDFGQTRSHGCINLPLWFAEWLWNWATYGTRLWIHY